MTGCCSRAPPSRRVRRSRQHAVPRPAIRTPIPTASTPNHSQHPIVVEQRTDAHPSHRERRGNRTERARRVCSGCTSWLCLPPENAVMARLARAYAGHKTGILKSAIGKSFGRNAASALSPKTGHVATLSSGAGGRRFESCWVYESGIGALDFWFRSWHGPCQLDADWNGLQMPRRALQGRGFGAMK